MKKLLVLLVVLLVFTLVFAGCKSTAPATTTPPASPTTKATSPTLTPKSGGTFQGGISEPYSLGYPGTMTGQTDGQTSSQGLETLFIFDKQYNLVPLLATGYTTDPVGKTITITLRKGVKFHDGTDFNATACKWNLDEYRSGGRPELKSVASVDVVDDYTVRINLSKFDNTIVNSLSNGADAGRMISPAACTKNGKAWAEKNPVGTGPYIFVSWEKDVAVKWKRNDNYWGGKPYIDAIVQNRSADATVALMDFKAGNRDVTAGVAPTDAKTLEKEGKYLMIIPPQGQVPALAGFAGDPGSPFSKLEVRQALSYAIDVKSLSDGFGLGYYIIQNQWAVPGTWGYNTSLAGYPFSLQKAKDLLTKAGYPSGFKTTLSFYNTGQIQVDESTAMQSMLKAVGIEVTLNPLLRPGFADIASNSKGFTGIVRQQGFSSPDPLLKYAGVAAGQEFTGMLVPQEFKDVYAQAVAAPDAVSKQKLVWQLESLAVDKYCMQTFLYMQPSPIFKNKRLHDDLYGEMPFYYMSPKAWLE